MSTMQFESRAGELAIVPESVEEQEFLRRAVSERLIKAKAGVLWCTEQSVRVLEDYMVATDIGWRPEHPIQETDLPVFAGAIRELLPSLPEPEHSQSKALLKAFNIEQRAQLIGGLGNITPEDFGRPQAR